MVEPSHGSTEVGVNDRGMAQVQLRMTSTWSIDYEPPRVFQLDSSQADDPLNLWKNTMQKKPFESNFDNYRFRMHVIEDKCFPFRHLSSRRHRAKQLKRIKINISKKHKGLTGRSAIGNVLTH